MLPITGVFIVALIVAILLNPQTGLMHLVPPVLQDPVRAVLVLAFGALLSWLLERYWFGRAQPGHGPLPARQVTTLRFMIRLVLYMAVAVGVLAAFGVGVPSVVFGGAFLTVVLGLAGQSVLANMLGGIWLVMFHPFEVGDRVEIITWQYPLLMPSYGHEALKPSYIGTITDVSLMYTQMATDTGLPMSIPNGILVQAAITNRNRGEVHRLRVRFEVDQRVDPDALAADIEQQLKPSVPGVEALMVDVSPTTYSVVVIVDHPGTDDAMRHRVLRAAWAALARSRAQEADPALQQSDTPARS